MGMVGAQAGLALIHGACRDRRRMEGIDIRSRFGRQRNHGAIARGRPAVIERRHHPKAAARIALGGIAYFLFGRALAAIAEGRQHGIVKMPCAIKVVSSERDVKKHGISGSNDESAARQDAATLSIAAYLILKSIPI